MGNFCHVLYFNETLNTFKFEELICKTTFESQDPSDYGLPDECSIILVLVKASMLGKYLDGKKLL